MYLLTGILVLVRQVPTVSINLLDVPDMQLTEEQILEALEQRVEQLKAEVEQLESILERIKDNE